MYHNPEAEGMINHMDKISAEFDVNKVHDLDNGSDLKFLHKNGLILKPGQISHFKVEGNPSTGYDWIYDEKSCEGHFKVTEKYITPPANEKRPEE